MPFLIILAAIAIVCGLLIPALALLVKIGIIVGIIGLILLVLPLGGGTWNWPRR